MLKYQKIFIIFLIWNLFIKKNLIKCVPLKHSNRMIREIYPELDPDGNINKNRTKICIVDDLIYGIDEMVPTEQTCLKCKCYGPDVQCETVKCPKKSGCKAVHKPNECCPQYQCECYHDGKVYGNGERITNLTGNECNVCYCRGGEVQCGKVSCYIRTDCQAKMVPGQCCPKYENCPLKEPHLLDHPYSTDLNKELLDLRPITTIIPNTTITSDFEKNPNNLTEIITIHEIIPEIKEIPIKSTKNNLILLNDSETESSQIKEIYQQPPESIIKIGDQILLLKNNGQLIAEENTTTINNTMPLSIVTIIGAEGLQRGEFEENSDEFLENNEKNSTTTNDSIETIEEIASDELMTTTSKNFGKILENETDASVELNLEKNTELFDMLLPENYSTTTENFYEVLNNTKILEFESENQTLPNDVELVGTIVSTKVPGKLLEKRQNSEDDIIFTELNTELQTNQTIDKNTGKTHEESQKIFEELHEETRHIDKNPMDKMSDFLSKFSLKSIKNDGNLFGLLSDFFNSQFKKKQK